MASFDDLDAPQFSNFDDFDQEEAEQYFEIDHESERLKVRRSLSSDNIRIPYEKLSAMCVQDGEECLENQKIPEKKFEYGALRKANYGSQSKLRFCSQESLNRLAAPKRIYSSNGNIAQSSSQYVSVAEAVRKFHQKTPPRFHSLNKKSAPPKNAVPGKLTLTIPMSPRLLTKKKVKTGEPVITHEQKLLLEFEKEQKFRVKANPVNKKILQPMKAVHVEKKPATVPEPFKLTKVEHKTLVSSPKKYQFHAKEVPKSVLEPPKLPQKQEVKITVPVTPSFVKKMPKPSPPKKEVEKPAVPKQRMTKPEPFSFEKRDLKLMKNKEEKIKKIVEEEKKAREFHARPIPKPVISLMSKQRQKSLDGSSSSLNHNEHSKPEQVEPFKARPPKVLYQKPFEPKKPDQPLTEIQPFNFNSDMRAKEREKFEQKKKEQEELAAMLLKQEEEERLRREEEERKRLREETKFKAQPIRNFKGVIIQPSGKVTDPVSPIFLSGKSNKGKNKENEM